MPKLKPHTHTRAGVGSQTVRLKDIPLATRLEALTRTHPKTEREAIVLLRLALDPQDAGGRITA